jgi:Domain of unknown function (DUF1707)
MTGEVSPASDPGQASAPVELRASHFDRDRVVEVLRIAAGDGRLTAEELDQRLEAALTARTLSELALLTTDLPAVAHSASVAAPQAKDLVRIECGSGSAKRDGQWVVPQRMEVKVTSGSVKLDFTEATITQPALQLDADVKSGALTLVTRPGVVVDADEVSVASGSVRVRPHRGPPAPVILRVEVTGRVRSGSISVRPPRRTFLQWLLRRPSL